MKKSAELPQARACEVTASVLQSIKLPILQIPPRPRGFEDWRLQGSLPRSRDPSSRDTRSSDCEFLVSVGMALLVIRLARGGDVRRGTENFQPTNQPPGLEDIHGFPDPWPKTGRHPSWWPLNHTCRHRITTSSPWNPSETPKSRFFFWEGSLCS